MRSQIVVDKEFNILSRSIDNATTCQVIKVDEDSFDVKLHDKGKFEVDESVELFAMTPKGQLYFETIVKEVKDNVISIWFPISYKYLQRREYSRIGIDKIIELEATESNIKAQIIDISAGGLKIRTQVPLELLKKYKTNIDIENTNIETEFEPIRIETDGQLFTSSGRFVDLKNSDRIALVQYCFRKQIENSNK